MVPNCTASRMFHPGDPYTLHCRMSMPDECELLEIRNSCSVYTFISSIAKFEAFNVIAK